MEPGDKNTACYGATANYIIMGALAVSYALQVHFDPEGLVIAPLILRRFTGAGLLGHMWLHMDAIHIIESLATLWVFGRFVVQRVRPLTYITLFVMMGIIAGVVHLMLDRRPTVGASGAIMGVLGLHVVLCGLKFGKLEPFLILLWFGVSVGFGMAALGPGAHLAHIGGFVTGMVYALVLLMLGIDDGSQAHPLIGHLCRRPSFRAASLIH